jgi:hypothetical protein
MILTEERLLELGFKPFGKSKDLYKKSCILHKRKRGWVINKRTPIMESVDQLTGYMWFALGIKL